MERVIEVEPRERLGTGGARALRRANRVPVVVYGTKSGDPLHVSVACRELEKIAGIPGFYFLPMEIASPGGKRLRVLARDIQTCPVSGRPLHVDMMEITPRTRLRVPIPVRFMNQDTCPGIKAGGVLDVVRREVELIGAVSAMPEHLDVDLSGVHVGDNIRISSANLPRGVRPTITGRDFIIANLMPPTVAETQVEATEQAEDLSEDDPES